MAELEELEKRLGHRFAQRPLLERALTHPSRAGEHPQTVTNQRLEFLGDAVLGLIIADKLFNDLPEADEGDLATARATLVRGTFLSTLARELGLGAHLRLSRQEENAGGRERDSSLEDALEAVVGALYLDAGMEGTRAVVLGWYGPALKRLEETRAAFNPKGRLNELAQAQFGANVVEYRVLGQTGTPPEEIFRVGVYLNGERYGEAEGGSKKTAEEAAARLALARLKQ